MSLRGGARSLFNSSIPEGMMLRAPLSLTAGTAVASGGFPKDVEFSSFFVI